MKGIFFACEYWDSRIYGWIKFYYSRDLEDCIRNQDAAIFGDPKTRLSKWEVNGKKWKLIEVIN